MSKFVVGIHGTGCWLGVEKRKWGILHRSVVRPMSFYTARLVEAVSPEEAGDKAVAMVQEEVKALHRQDHRWSVSVKEVWEDTSQLTGYPPDGGFIWYPEDDSSLD